MRYGGEGDFGANVAGFETIAFGDLSLLVKFGVQFGLFGGAVQQLGSVRHHERYLHDIATLKLPGWLRHVRGRPRIRRPEPAAPATYDRDTQEFVVDTTKRFFSMVGALVQGRIGGCCRAWPRATRCISLKANCATASTM